MSFSGHSNDSTIEGAVKIPLDVAGFFSNATARLVVVLAAIIPVALLSIGLVIFHSSSTSGSAAAFLNSGVAQANAGAYLAAEDSYIRAVLASPTNAHGYRALAYYDLGVCFQRTGFPNVAVAYYQKSLALNPKDAGAWYNLAIAQTSTPAVAIKDYDKALAITPNYPQALLNSGLLLFQTGNKTEGTARMKKAVLLDAALTSRVPQGIKL